MRIYKPDWNSLDSRPIPDWFGDAKFGIFIHWGVYSVPSWAPKGRYAEWYWYDMYNSEETKKFHNKTYGKSFKYQDFAPMFKAELFDPEKWAELFYNAGAKYVVLTSKHHDGFCLWKSQYSWNWNSVDIGPKRDLVKEITSAVRKKGLKMGLYYSLYEWFNPLYQKNVNLYVEKYMLPQLKELILKYKPSLLYTDGEWEYPSEVWKSKEFLAWLFNSSPVKNEIVVNDRWGKETRTLHGGYWTSEYGGCLGEGREITPFHIWEETRGIGSSFGYNRNEDIQDYSSAKDLLHLLINTVSKGGNLLLDVGPTSDGRIPVIMQERLIEIGNWLKVNGEAIYGTKPFLKIENRDVKYTSKGKILYAICLNLPSKNLVLNLKPTPITSLKILGEEKKLRWKIQGNKINIEIPQDIKKSYAYVFKIQNTIF
jgi:alpha-L-fucosidase